jgi:hypothetical protein
VFISDPNRDEPVGGAMRAGGPIEIPGPQGFELDLPH